MSKIRELAQKATPGPTEFGVIPEKSLDAQVEWYKESLSKGLINDGLIDVYGVYIAGSDTPICHTGNGPTSAANAAFIAACSPECILAYEDCVEALRRLVKLVRELSPSKGQPDENRAVAALAALDASEEP